MRFPKAEILGTRSYFSLLSRVATTWMISSTKPSKPMSAFLLASEGKASEIRWQEVLMESNETMFSEEELAMEKGPQIFS